MLTDDRAKGRRPPISLATSPGALDVHEFDRRTADLDEGDGYAAAWVVRLDDDPLAFEGDRQIVNFECHMRHRLDQFGIRRIVQVALPLNTERVIQMITDRHLQMRQRNLTVEGADRRDPDMVELHRTACDWLNLAVLLRLSAPPFPATRRALPLLPHPERPDRRLSAYRVAIGSWRSSAQKCLFWDGERWGLVPAMRAFCESVKRQVGP
jgi:hypothetical protein